MTARRLVVRRLGRVEYQDGLALMAALEREHLEGRGQDTLLLVEHPRVITLGRGAKAGNLLVPRESLEALGVGVFETDRGGDVTWHGPGQLVAYPVLDLRPDRQDVRKYVRGVEESILRTLAAFGIEAGRIPRWTGVWVGEAEDPAAVKIAAIGVHLKRWVTTHGLALNVAPDLSDYQLIVPCGIQGRGVTSMTQVLGQPVSLAAVETALARSMGEVFESRVEERDVDAETVSVAVVRPGREGPEVLVLRRTASRGGFPQIVTGRIEPGEAPAEAAARELKEETGLSPPVRSLSYVHSFGFAGGTEVLREHAFFAVAPADAAVRLDPGEHEAGDFLPLRDAERALPFAGLKEAVRRAASLLPGV